jgi:hypothetical protein
MNASRKRLGKSIKEKSREVVKRTWTLTLIQGRENE